MAVNWDFIEKKIKESDNHLERFKFTFEQTSHAYINLFVEKLREWNVPMAYEIGHIIGYGLLIPISFLAPIIAVVGIAKVVYDRMKPTRDV